METEPVLPVVSEQHASESMDYQLHKYDSELLYSFIDKYVEVKLIKNVSFTGFIHSIDPISHSIILLLPKDYTFQTSILPGHGILKIICKPPGDLRPPMRLTRVPDDEEAKRRKENLIAWFKWNLLPVQEFDDKIIVQSVNILSPYTTSDIYAENPVITLQIRKIMEQMPPEMPSK